MATTGTDHSIKGFQLTNQSAKLIHKNHASFIPLNQISSINYKYTHEPIILILAFVSLAVGCIIGFNEFISAFWAGFVICAIFIGIYYRFKGRDIKISSPTDSIILNCDNMSRDECLSFIDDIESAITSKPYSQSRQSREAKWGSGR